MFLTSFPDQYLYNPAVQTKFALIFLAGLNMLLFYRLAWRDLRTLGPDTLKELRAAAGVGRVHAFVDMHDIGDMLVAAGFSAPVMDMEMLSLAYPRGADLLADLRASGQTCARGDRPRGLAGRRGRERLLAALAAQASFEVV